MVNQTFSAVEFSQSYILDNDRLLLTNNNRDRLAQIIANFLVKKLIANGQKCSLETVFSHPGKVEMMRNAARLGYKVYLYFVATNDPEINVGRVKSRAQKGGHDVPEERIRDRYIRSLNLMYEASNIAYQCYFFDNSGGGHKLIAHFKVEDGGKKWDAVQDEDLPDWFIEYYVNKQKQP